MPYPSAPESAACLDRVRLGRQRSEVLTILGALGGTNKWGAHPAVKMWTGYDIALAAYGKTICDEWIKRGYNDTCLAKLNELYPGNISFADCAKPWWVGWEPLHASHRSNLLRKDPEYYSQYGWATTPDTPYVWPWASEKGFYTTSKKDGNGKTKIAIVGHGRAGKDTAGLWFGEHTNLRYVGSTSNVVCPLIATELGISEEQAWLDRHNNRIFWREWCDNYRKDDPVKIVRASLKLGDIVVGIRGGIELATAKKLGLIDLVIWIANNRVPVDPTVDFTSDDCDVVVENNGTIESFHDRLRSLAQFAKLI